MIAFAVFALALAAGGWLVARPLRTPAVPWPAETPDERDDIARAVSSLRDLEFARAAGSIDAADEATLRRAIERSAFTAREPVTREAAPVRTLVVAALLAGIASVLVIAYLPRAVGDRAPGTTLTGTLPSGPTLADLEKRAAASPTDVPTLLALADAYRDEQRASDASATYRRVLVLDPANVPALNGLALILFASGERDGALLATQRVLALRPRDPDALFLDGLIRYQKGDFKGATDDWRIFLDVGEFHPGAAMVRSLYEDARKKSGAP
jgi:cytochrome c-type biogenesis protein CcmH/NrfG